MPGNVDGQHAIFVRGGYVVRIGVGGQAKNTLKPAVGPFREEKVLPLGLVGGAFLAGDGQPTIVDLYSDSQYVLKGLEDWMEGWKARGWRTAATFSARRTWDSASLPSGGATIGDLENATSVNKVDPYLLNAQGKHGWYVELQQDERMVRDPLVFEGTAYFKTTKPKTLPKTTIKSARLAPPPKFLSKMLRKH